MIAWTSASLAAGAPETSDRTEYDGEFSEVTVSSGAGSGVCEQVFAVSTYHNLHVLTGPTGRTSVLNFANEPVDGEPPSSRGFFHGINFVGLYGGSGDLYYEKTITKDGAAFAVLAEGFADRAVVYLEFTVEARDAASTPDAEPLCRATATYAGFN
jgi:hypothetical protein